MKRLVLFALWGSVCAVLAAPLICCAQRSVSSGVPVAVLPLECFSQTTQPQPSAQFAVNRLTGPVGADSRCQLPVIYPSTHNPSDVVLRAIERAAMAANPLDMIAEFPFKNSQGPIAHGSQALQEESPRLLCLALLPVPGANETAVVGVVYLGLARELDFQVRPDSVATAGEPSPFPRMAVTRGPRK